MRKIWFLLLALLPMIGKAKEGDWGYAQVNFIKVSLADKWSILSRSQITFRDDFSELYFWYADAGLAYSFAPAWRAELAFRHAEWDFGGGWLQEERPMLNLDWFGNVKGVKLNNRARVEYRHYTWRKDDWRFRNRFRAEFPWKLAGISPFIEEELFYGYNRGAIEMNWLSAGVQYKPAKRVKLKVGYRWIAIRAGNEWENRNQLVTGLALFF
ncbi:DUF2490 domain-containing protein [Pontiellaceae bacterium B12227]|nr:DUF2490 domain-containing protein [Pontiellaceae bacterium B12227]